MYKVKMFLGIVFICSMGYLVCVCTASLIGEEISEETKGSYEKVVVGCAREVCSQYVVKVMFAVEGNKLWSHSEFHVSGGFGERRACLH